MKYFCLALYYLLARWLPVSYSRFFSGKNFRYFLCKRIFKKCGKNVNIERGAFFGSGSNIEIGDNSGIGINCKVPSDIIIGNDVMMAPDCYFLESITHNTESVDIPMNMQGDRDVGHIVIEDDCWIGTKVIVLPGRHISKGSIIGAGCVLTKDYPIYSVVGGNPSRLIKSRIKKK